MRIHCWQGELVVVLCIPMLMTMIIMQVRWRKVKWVLMKLEVGDGDDVEQVSNQAWLPKNKG